MSWTSRLRDLFVSCAILCSCTFQNNYNRSAWRVAV